MKISKLNFVLLAILILAFVLRFYRLDSLPAFNADEAAIGYNVYSLIQTGKDEHGNAWPIHFQSFNDYKPGLYFYLVLPFVKVLGLTELAVRIPSAFLGVLTVLVLYFLVKELFNKQNLALISALFLAISPWHIHFSRGGWEVNVATFFITLGLYFALQALKKPYLKNLTAALLPFVLALYTYHSARIVVPLLGLGLLLIYRQEIGKNIRSFLITGVLGFILLLPLVFSLKGGVLARASGVGLLADPGPRSRVEEQRGEHQDLDSIATKGLHNKIVNYGLAFLENWGKHYWGEFLFLSGDEIQRNKVPETGQLYLFEIVTVGFGLVFLIKNTENKNTKLILYWLLIAPVAAALTFQSPHALRAHNMIIPLTIISALGSVYLIKLVKYRKLAIFVFGAIVFWSFVRYLHMYYTHMIKEYPFSSQYGVKELVQYISENQDNYSKIIVTDRYDQPYILFLFYGVADGVSKYDPAKFQTEHQLTGRDNFGFSTVSKFGKYEFTSIDFDKLKSTNPNSLIIGTEQEIPKEANIIKDIYGANNYLYFRIVKN